MKKLLLLFFLSANVWGLTLEELMQLENHLKDTPMAPTSFLQQCYDLVAKEENPRHLKILSSILDKAQKVDSDELMILMKGYEGVLKNDG